MEKTLQGIVWLLVALFFFTLMDATAKTLIGALHLMQIIWVRYMGQLIFVLFISKSDFRAVLRTSTPRIQLVRALSQFFTSLSFFAALGSLSLASATSLFNIAPIFITIGAAIFLGEYLGRRRLIAVFIGFLGALLIIRPGTDMFSYGSFYALLAGLSYSCFAITTRYVGLREDARTSLFYSGLIGSALSGSIVLFYWITPTFSQLGILAILALAGTCGQYFMIRAFTLTQASILAPWTYIGFLYSVFWGLIWFGEFPDWATWLGALAIIGSGIYVLLAKNAHSDKPCEPEK